MNNNTLQWTADEPDPQRGYCGHHAYARVGNYAISPSVSFGSLVRYRVSYMPTGTVMESRTIGHYRSLKEAKAAAQRDHDQKQGPGTMSPLSGTLSISRSCRTSTYFTVGTAAARRR